MHPAFVRARLQKSSSVCCLFATFLFYLFVSYPDMYSRAELEASWEAWRHAESGLSSREPTVRISVDVDCVELDLRPEELAALTRVRDVLNRFMASGDEDDVRIPILPQNFTKQSV